MTAKYIRVANLLNAGKSKAEVLKALKTTSVKFDNLKHIAKIRGLLKPAASAKATPVVGGQQVWPKPTVDIRSAIIYLRQAQGKSPRFAKALAELALLTLLGEDK